MPLATHAPERTCIGCRRARAQSELVRLVRTPDGVARDDRRRLPGRGAYVCPDPACVDAALARGARAVRHALRGVDEVQARQVLQSIRPGGEQAGEAGRERAREA